MKPKEGREKLSVEEALDRIESAKNDIAEYDKEITKINRTIDELNHARNRLKLKISMKSKYINITNEAYSLKLIK